MSEKHQKIKSSTYRPDFKVYQYVKLEGVKTNKPKLDKQRFSSPIFGTKVPDKIVIPNVGDSLGDNSKRLDAFRDEKKISDAEKMAKYGTLYPEFGIVSNKTRETILGGIIEEDKIEDSGILLLEKEEVEEKPILVGNFKALEIEPEEVEEATIETNEEDDEFIEEPKVGAFKGTGFFETKPLEEEEIIVKPLAKPKSKPNRYIKPDPNMFSQSNLDKEQRPDWVLRHIDIINQTLIDFNIEGEVSGSTKGPTVTRYELKLSPGVNVKRVENISDTLMMNLASTSIRIEAPIPGKPYVGIEIPNDKPEIVPFGNVVNDKEFTKSKDKPLLIGLGVDIDGNNVYVDIQSMPHGLIAGATNSGKSVSINTFLASLLLKNTPDELRLLLIDPKYVELSIYNDLPHLITPVITEAKMASQALSWVVKEMDERYELLAENQSRDIKIYNEKVETKRIEGEKLPYIVVVIDELADLMQVASQDVEASIQRITQKARAAGIHLIVATQRPSKDVIKGTIKSNIPSRIAFRVSSFVDSTTILDHAGAESLLGKGDMLIKLADRAKRLQGAYIKDEEIEDLISFIKEQADPNYEFEHQELERRIEVNDTQDELLEEVAYFIVENQNASINGITEHFRVRFYRAQKIVKQLEQFGIVSESKGTKARDVLVSVHDLEGIFRNEN